LGVGGAGKSRNNVSGSQEMLQKRKKVGKKGIGERSGPLAPSDSHKRRGGPGRRTPDPTIRRQKTRL